MYTLAIMMGLMGCIHKDLCYVHQHYSHEIGRESVGDRVEALREV